MFYLCGVIANMASNGSSGSVAGLRVFVSPVNAWINRIYCIQPTQADSARDIFIDRINSGVGQTPSPGSGAQLPIVANNTPVELEVPPFIDQRHVLAGEGFTIASGGEGATASEGFIVVEMVPA